MAVPRSHFDYSCVGYIVAGFLAERVAGAPLGSLIDDVVCRPLGLRHTGFGPVPRSDCAATEHDHELGRGLVWGEVHDPLAWRLGGSTGNAGLFSCLYDLGLFGRALRAAVTGQPSGLLSARLAREALRDRTPPHQGLSFRHWLGLRMGDDAFMGPISGGVGHHGFTGTMLVVDRDTGALVVLLTNRLHPSQDQGDVNDLCRDLSALALGAAESAHDRRR